MLIPSGPSHDPDRLHLHVICTEPDSEEQQLLVSICTKINNLCDSACTVMVHEHPSLTRESYVLYRKAEIVKQSALANGVAANLLIPREDMNGQTFLRITKGLCLSAQTPRKIKQYFGCPPANRSSQGVI